MVVEVPWGDGSLRLDLPASWEVCQVASPSPVRPLDSLEAELERALETPVGHPPIRGFVKPEHRVAYVVDDIGRPTPAHRILPALLHQVADAGVPRERQTLVFATGLHRGLTEEEMIRKVGPEVFRSIRCLNHDARKDADLVHLGTTSRGTPVRFNRHVAEADVRILVGTVEPHVQAGFGGGCKNLLPGVAGVGSIGHNHFLGAHPKLFSMIGFPPERNPMRQDLEEAARRLRGSTFIVNTILTPTLEVARIVAGHAIHAHREGLKVARSIYGVRIGDQADIVVTNSFPLDVNLRQDVKAVANALFAARPGGSILALFRSRLGLDDVKLPTDVRLPLGLVRGALRCLPSWMIRALATTPLNRIPVEERFFLYFGLQALRRNRISVFSPTLAAQLNGRVRGLPITGRIEEALARAGRGRRSRVIVFPAGGVTYPILEAEA